MPLSESARLRRWADELDAEERAEKEAALEDKVAALENGRQTDEKDREIEELKAKLAALEAADDDPPPPVGDPPPAAIEVDNDDDPPPALTRPGRKSGAAYDWYVGEDGQVIQSDTAIVYSGPDEPESVAL